MPAPPFVATGFTPPPPPTTGDFVLLPLTLEHNEADLEAWSSSVEHIHATPGFEGRPWPDEPMTLARNAADLQMHMDDFATGRGFTYTVLGVPDGDVIGCVYIYPSEREGADARLRSWVRASRAPLDGPLARTVRAWLEAEWPFTTYDDARDGVSADDP